MKISLAITTYNRFDLPIKSCAQVLNDPRIDDIVILDDKSTDGSYEKLRDYFVPYAHVRVMQQAYNRGMSRNKADAISYATNEWVAIIDSDNVVAPEYFDAFENDRLRAEWEFDLVNFSPTLSNTQMHPKTVIYCPDFAMPNFNFTNLAAVTINRNNVAQLLRGPHGKELTMSLNCCNYIVHRDEYLNVYQHNPEMKATDTLWFSYLWLAADNSFYIVPDMRYEHLVHSRSGFLEDAKYNMEQSEKIKKMIMAL